MTREEAIKWIIYEKDSIDTEGYCATKENYARIQALDMAIEALTRPKGEWIEVEDYNGDVHYKCDQCGEEWTFPYGTPKENNANFCPNCGARMKGGAE